MVVDLAPVYGNETANSLGLDTSGKREVSLFVLTSFSSSFYVGYSGYVVTRNELTFK